MTDHVQRAKELFDSGYNCAQSAFGAFCEDFGLDFETAMRLSSSFGGGVGGLREVCGAVSGICLAAGQRFGFSDSDDKTAKAEHYALIQRMAQRFIDKNDSIICRELLAKGSDNMSPEERHHMCSGFVASAAEILEDELKASQAEIK